MTVTPVKAWADDRSGTIRYYIDGKELMVAGEVPLALLSDYTRGYIIRGGASDWEAYAANTDGAILIGDGTDIVSDTTPSIAGTVTFRDGFVLTTGGDADLNNYPLYLDADRDTYIVSNVDDFIYIYVAGALDFVFGANTFWVQAGSQIIMGEDTTIGFSGGGHFVFDSTPNPDQIKLTNADLYIATSSHGIIHVDGVTAGDVLRADGTRFIPATLSVTDLGSTDLGDPGADRVVFWDDSDNQFEFLVVNTGLEIDGNNLNCTITDTNLTQEEVEDFVGGMVTGNTETLIAVTYQDADGTLDFVVDEASINHDALTNFAANEHIDHTAVSISVSGTGLGGGGDISANRTITLTSTSDGAANHSTILASSAAGALTLDDLFLPDGGTVGISGNELITFNAAGTIAFSGVSGVSVEDGDWIGAGSGCAWLFDSSNSDISTTAKVGIGNAAPDGTLHVHTATAGAVTANEIADDLVVENNTEGGISILVPDASNANLVFGSPSDSIGALIRWNHDADLVTIGSANGGAEVSIVTANVVEAIRIDSNQNVGINAAAPTTNAHIYENNTDTTPALLIEQDGTGDAAISWLLTGGVQWSAGIDNSISGDPWILSSAADLSDPHVMVTTGGIVFVNESANTDMTLGITITQDAGTDDEIFCGKNGNVAQSFTDYAEADTFVTLQKHSSSAGGALFRGFRDNGDNAGWAMVIQGYLSENADTTKSVAGGAIVVIDGLITDGSTGIGDANANANIVCFRTNRGSVRETVAIIDEDGDFYYDGALNNYDDYDDALAVRDAAQVLAGNWNDAIAYNAQALAAMGVISLNPDGSPAMVSHKRMTALMAGAIGQLYERVQELEARA